MSKVSVIIPLYGKEEHFVPSLETILGQTMEDIEIICVVGDCSEDFMDTLENYTNVDSRMLICDYRDRDYGKAMNSAIENASGDYIGFVKPGDYVSECMYEELYKKAVDYNLDILFSDYAQLKKRKKEEVVSKVSLSSDMEKYNIVLETEEYPTVMLHPANICCGIYKKSYLKNEEIKFDEIEGSSYQDHGFWMQSVVCAKRLVLIPTTYYTENDTLKNKETINREYMYGVNIEYDHIRNILMKDQNTWERFQGVYWLKKYKAYMETMSHIESEYKKEFIQRFGAELKRGLDKQELDSSVFSLKIWANVQLLAADPNGYYKTHVWTVENEKMLRKQVALLQKENDKLVKEKQQIKDSKAYRLGMLLLAVPKKIKGRNAGKKGDKNE